MSVISLNLLGTFRATVDGRPITDFATAKVRALLSYLALESTHPHTRTGLAALLWPQLSSENAFDNLRKSIYRLRQTLERSAPNAAPVVEVARQTLQFVAPPETVDALTFQSLLAEALAHEHSSIETCDACLGRLTQAAELYRGELLAGFGVPDAPAFEEWLLHWRESLRQQALQTLITLSKAWEARADLPRALLPAERMLYLDPYREDAHRQKMRLLHQMGLGQQALAHYEACRRMLKEELGVEPDEATTALAEQIRAGNHEGKLLSADLVLAEPARPSPNHPQSPYHPQSNVPEHGRIYGRQHDLERLTRWITQDRCRLVALLGMGGIGKTTLAAAALRAVADDFDIVLWRSLINAPPLDEILSDWLRILSGDAMAHLPESLDAQLARLLDCLRERRCLLVLDNMESIFQAGQAGQLRPEHQGYTQLLRRIGELPHRSCLLLTSREQPHTFARLEDDLFNVRSLQLEGLNVYAAQSILQDRGLAKQSLGLTSLVALYSGNPLALKLVAETVLELFGGNIEAFLAAEAVIFEDIRAVLDWQFERLSSLEQEILLWLAVEREPISLQVLRGNLAPARPPVEVLAALRGLQRRSLLDQVDVRQHETHFTLQNVLVEYLTDRLIRIAYQEIQRETLLHLHRHALIKAQANEYVRQSQVRLILQPLAERLQATMGRDKTIRKLTRILAALRAEPSITYGYGAGNILNLLILLEVDLTGYDFSRLCVWQADLRHASLPAVNFAGADLSHSCFAEGFGFIYTVAYSPDRAVIAAGTNNGEIRLWQASDGRLLQIFQGHKGTVKSVAFSPDGRLLASGGEDETVRLWDIAGKPASAFNEVPFLRVLKGHRGRVTAVAFHPDGKMLASGGVDQTVRLWDVATGVMTAVLHGHEHWVWALAFHPSGATLASASFDHTIRLWDVKTATARSVLRGHKDTVSGVVFAQSGAQLASCSFDGTVRLWDTASGRLLQTLTELPDEINAIAVSPNGEFLVYGGDDNVATLWDLHSGSVRHRLYGHDSDVLTIAFSSDGKTLVTGSSDQTVRLWDVPEGRPCQIFIGYSQGIRTLAYHPTGKVVASAHYDHRVRLWNMESRRIDQVLHGHTKAVQVVTFRDDGAWLASGGDDQTIVLWRLVDRGRAQRRHVLHSQHSRVTSLAFSPDGATLVSGGYGQQVGLWDVESGRLRRLLPEHDSPVFGAQFSPDGSLLAIVGGNQSIRLWDTHDDTLVHVWHGHKGSIYTVAFTPDGQILATGGGDGVICLWDIHTPEQPVLSATFVGHTDRVFAIAFSRDGRRMVSGSADRGVVLWDMQNYRRIRTMHGHTHWVWAVGISPDGNGASSGGPDETLRLWDLQSGECLAALTGSGPYAGMNVSETTGITHAERAMLIRLGAVEHEHAE